MHEHTYTHIGGRLGGPVPIGSIPVLRMCTMRVVSEDRILREYSSLQRNSGHVTRCEIY